MKLFTFYIILSSYSDDYIIKKIKAIVFLTDWCEEQWNILSLKRAWSKKKLENTVLHCQSPWYRDFVEKESMRF